MPALTMPPTPPARLRRASIWFALAAIVAIGGALRFHRLDEMEYKEDERWMYEHALAAAGGAGLPAAGMRSSVGLPNPALSVWVFVGLAKILPVSTPVGLASGVVLLNSAALLLVFVFAEAVVDERERSAWRWGGALAAVSPFAILLQRKIWAQSVLPLFSVLFLLGWWRRDRRWGALLWGVLGACLGQIHMSGLFFAAAFVLWERYAGPRRATRREVCWRWFGAGAFAGGVGLAIWAVQLVAALGASLGMLTTAAPAAGPRLAGVMDSQFLSLWPPFWVDWASDAAGFGLEYSLGPHYRAFLHGPAIAGRQSWLALGATLVSAGTTAAMTARWARDALRDLWAKRLAARIGAMRETAFAEGAALGVFGLLLTATLKMHRHYLIVAYPLPWVWLSRLVLRRRRGRALLAAIWIAQLVVSLSYLGYIHDHHGAEGGDYGRGYRWQTSGGRTSP